MQQRISDRAPPFNATLQVGRLEGTLKALALAAERNGSVSLEVINEHISDYVEWCNQHA